MVSQHPERCTLYLAQSDRAIVSAAKARGVNLSALFVNSVRTLEPAGTPQVAPVPETFEGWLVSMQRVTRFKQMQRQSLFSLLWAGGNADIDALDAIFQHIQFMRKYGGIKTPYSALEIFDFYKDRIVKQFPRKLTTNPVQVPDIFGVWADDSYHFNEHGTCSVCKIYSYIIPVKSVQYCEKCYLQKKEKSKIVHDTAQAEFDAAEIVRKTEKNAALDLWESKISGVG